jgi:hypothetical protein
VAGSRYTALIIATLIMAAVIFTKLTAVINPIRMYTPHYGFICFLLLCLCTSCQYGPGAPQEKAYFDLAGFLDQQGAHLDAVPTEVKRLNEINGQQEEVHVSALNWSREMNYLYEADINRPSWRGEYTTDSVFSEQRQLQAIRYTPGNTDLPVQLLAINYNTISGQIESIEATVKDRNMLYDASRDIQLQLMPDATGTSRVSSYKIEGRQKVIGQDPVTFKVAGRILYMHP